MDIGLWRNYLKRIRELAEREAGKQGAAQRGNQVRATVSARFTSASRRRRRVQIQESGQATLIATMRASACR
jgi:hypothetical protein